MSGTDLHDLFARVLDDEPPMAAGYPQEALAAGRRRQRQVRGRVLVASLTAGVLVGGLAVVGGARGWNDRAAVPASPTPTGPSSPATDPWRGFPVDADPRPIVLTGSPVLDPADGFGSGADKLAFANGAFTLAAQLPAGPSEAAGYPLTSAQNALSVLRTTGAGMGTTAPGTAPALVITEVTLGEAQFSTDRGDRTLPAWLFHLDGAASPAAVLAVAPPAVYDQPRAGYSGRLQSAVADAASSRTLVLRFVGAPPGQGPCTADYAADLVQTPWAVSVTLQETRHPGPTAATDQPTLCAAVGYIRQLVVTLDQPLGNRVLVDQDGLPLPVRPH